jgi:hypothetical protein
MVSQLTSNCVKIWRWKFAAKRFHSFLLIPENILKCDELQSLSYPFDFIMPLRIQKSAQLCMKQPF